MKVVILAAGKGTRMGELTKGTPKPLLSINGKPFLGYTLENLLKLNIRESDIILVVSYLKEQIEDFVKKAYPQITCVEQKEPLGTGHAVLQAKEATGDSPFVVLNGDNYYYLEDLKHLTEQTSPSILAFHHSDPKHFGVLITDNGQLKRIEEKPEHPNSDLVNAGAYVFTKEIYDEIENLAPSPRGEIEVTDAINNTAKQFMVIITKQGWKDLGKPEDVPKMEAFLGEQHR